MHVFTYGTLMFGPVWERVVTGRYRSLPATLDGFCRLPVRGQPYPALRSGPAAGDGPGPVAGLLYLDVDPADLARLDAFEGPDYRRIRVEVRLQAGRALATAGTYLFISGADVEAGEWDPDRFERESLAGFLRDLKPSG